MPELEIWGAHRSFLENYLGQRAATAAEFLGKEADILAFFASENRDDELDGILKINDDTAYIAITGGLSNEGADRWDRLYGWGGTGYKQIIAAADRIEADARIEKVELSMDTPGGRFLGLDNAWKRLMALRKGRHIIAINEGMVASAGYYLASAAHKIYSTSETNQVGSIGVMCAGIDWSKSEKAEGIKRVVIVSKNAPKKHVDISTQTGKDTLQDEVDDAETFFLDRISKGRKVSVEYITENFGQGGLLYSQSPVKDKPDALSVKMIDKIINVSSEAGGARSPVSINLKKEKKMDLTALLATDQDARAEYDRTLAAKGVASFAEGHKAGRAEVVAESEKIFSFMTAESPYVQNQPIQKACLAALKGEQPLSNVENLVSMADMMTEKEKSQGGQKESEEAGDTPGEHDPDPNLEGKVKDKESMDAAVSSIKHLV